MDCDLDIKTQIDFIKSERKILIETAQSGKE
jgi:hypothetical protein